MLDRLSGIGLTTFPLIANGPEADPPNETPTTGISSLPTPDLKDDNWVEVHISEWTPEGDHVQIQPPGAPLMKDLDSFTEGTGKGSFDSIPADITNEMGEVIQFPNPWSLELLPRVDIMLLIEAWREEVAHNYELTDNESRASEVGPVYLDTGDTADSLSQINLGPNLEISADPPNGQPDITFPLTASSPMITTSVPTIPCNTKRARSFSPDSHRRIRPRSRSLLSARSANTNSQLRDISFSQCMAQLVQSRTHYLPPD